MRTPLVMPRQGQTVESCIIAAWKKQPGDPVAAGDVIAEVETDKAVVEVESPVSGVLVEHLYPVGADVPVMQVIAYLADSLAAAAPSVSSPVSTAPVNGSPVSPRARQAAAAHGIALDGVTGSGPGGRIIERDVKAALERPRMTPVAEAMVAAGEYTAPSRGTGPHGRITKRDLEPANVPVTGTAAPVDPGVTLIPLKGVRKVIAARLLESMQTTAQLTLHRAADARALQTYRARLKAAPAALELGGVTINDLVLFAVSRALLQHPDLNATFDGMQIAQYRRVDLGFAVDTPRGLLVPVIRDAAALSLKQISAMAKRLAAAAQDGKIAPDAVQGGTFSVTNLGGLGIEAFTPIVNPPQVGILGIGAIALHPVQSMSGVEFMPQIALSLTIDHRVVDGAPGARFLATVADLLAAIDVVVGL